MQTQKDSNASATFPQIVPMGVTGLLVRFGDAMSEAANRAALAFAESLSAEPVEQVLETAPSLVSVFLRFDPVICDIERLQTVVEARLKERDWYHAQSKPSRVWRIPASFDGPNLCDVATGLGQSEAALVQTILDTPVRVLTLGFAPGQPYLGLLPDDYDVPRQKGIVPNVPRGALVTAVRQLIIFTNDTPTGWHHIGNSAFRCFEPERREPILFRPGDEVRFVRCSGDELDDLQNAPNGMGGAQLEVLS